MVVPMTWLDWARSVWWFATGEYLLDRDADTLLWGHTGFPGFWRGPDEPRFEAERQIQGFATLRGDASW